MAPRLEVGDKCPQCKVGLIEKDELGLSCDRCSWNLEIAEVAAANKAAETTAGEYRYRPARVSIRIATPEIGEEFMRGLILARQNNNSKLFVDLIEAVNELLQPYNAAKLAQEMADRSKAGMP